MTTQPLTTLSLPAATTFPSPNCIQWTEDGQMVVLTRQAIVIMTLELGITVGLSSVLRQTLDKGPGQEGNSLGWYKTMIERGKDGEPHQWAYDCQEWSAVALGSTDLSFVGLTCSPSNLYADGSCVIAVLDSNFEVALYKPVKNQLSGRWTKIDDLADAVADAVNELAKDSESSIPSLFHTLHKQLSSISWSLQTNFGMTPAPCVDSSVLAAGTCAGSVHLLRYHGHQPVPIEVVETIEVSEKRITHLSWSTWKNNTPKQAEALLACAVADGSVTIIKITQSLELRSSSPVLLKEYKITLAQEILDNACEPTRRTTTSLRWITLSSSEPVLVFSKPGTIHLWKPDDNESSWTGLRTIALKTQKLSVGSTALAPVSGIVYLSRHDSVVVSLSDGSFHVIKNLSTAPILASDDPAEAMSSKSLSTLVRQHFVNIEGEGTRKLDVNSTHGMTNVDGESTFLWIHEAVRPTDFTYKHDAQHSGTVVMAELFNGDSNDRILDDLRKTIQDTSRSTGETTIAILRRLFIHLYRNEAVVGKAEGLLEIISTANPVDDSLDVKLISYDGDFNDDLRQQLRKSLCMHIFGRPGLLSRRLRVCLANFCGKRCEKSDIQNAFRLAGTDAVQELWTVTLRIMIRHINALSTVLTQADVPFARRIAIHAMNSGISEAAQLSEKLDKLALDAPNTNVLEELCPACNAIVPFTDPATAVCANGHHWPRCSITSYILATPMTRTCISCTKKAFLPPPTNGSGVSWLPAGARSWLLEDVLDAVRRCLYCGNNFVTLV
ncbi:putative zinc-finger of transcription factor IIIC complex-domain-containing protein [Irpex lacteus]|nr:putative zinc-finger of transcription factor IIIC complex-domain-containing protein [Irpex lacteus]